MLLLVQFLTTLVEGLVFQFGIVISEKTLNLPLQGYKLDVLSDGITQLPGFGHHIGFFGDHGHEIILIARSSALQLLKLAFLKKVMPLL